MSKMFSGVYAQYRLTDSNMKRAEFSTELKLKHKLKSKIYGNDNQI